MWEILFLCIPHIYLENIGAARSKSTRKQYQTLLSPRVMFWWYSVLLVVLHIKHVFQNTICLKSFGHLSLITIERPYFIYMINVVFVCRCIKCTHYSKSGGHNNASQKTVNSILYTIIGSPNKFEALQLIQASIWFKLLLFWQNFDFTCTHTPEKRRTVDHKHFNVRHLILFEKYFKLFEKPSARLAFLICLQTSLSTQNAFFDLMHLKFDKPTTRAPFFYILQQ